MNPASRLLCGIALAGPAFSSAALAQQTVAIDLTGLQLRNATNQSRSSAPNTINPSFRYSYTIAGNVKGVGGALGFLYPTPTPLATVMEALAPGSSAGLSGTIENCTGTHPITQPPATTSGISNVSGIDVTYAFTLTTGISAANIASFSITDVTLTPSFLIGYIQFTSGSTTITRIDHCPANCDDSTALPILNTNDFQCFLNQFAAADPRANCDCSTAAPVLNANDFQCFVNKFAAGCP